MAYIETALVSSAGKLLIQLDDGTVIDAGYVRGGQGPAGRDGADGSPGIPGAKGDPGENGAKWHTGVGAPEVGLGENGDLYMDVAASVLPIYQKVGGNWMFLANLKVTPAGGGGGGGGGGGTGDGRPPIIFPPPNPGDKPILYPGGGGLEDGDIWWDPDSGYLYIYLNGQWHPVGERPPVAIGENPPIWGPSGDIDNRYPIVEGDLWFDSDQLALYVAVEDTNGNLVWVITTPADRSVVQDIQTSFTFPADSTGEGGGYASNGDTVYNPTTELWYVYNASKKQWIDLPPGQNELQMKGILLYNNFNNDTFEYEQTDRDTYGTDALVYINDQEHDNTTRLVVPKTDLIGFDWGPLLTGLTIGDQVSLLQVELGDPDQGISDQTLRTDYLLARNLTQNLETFSFEVDFAQQIPADHLPKFGETVSIRFKAVVNLKGDIFYQDQAPADDGSLLEGNLWVESDTLLLYVWTGSEWAEVGSACGGSGAGGDGLGLITTRDVKTIPRDDGQPNPFEKYKNLLVRFSMKTQPPSTQSTTC